MHINPSLHRAVGAAAVAGETEEDSASPDNCATTTNEGRADMATSANISMMTPMAGAGAGAVGVVPGAGACLTGYRCHHQRLETTGTHGVAVAMPTTRCVYVCVCVFALLLVDSGVWCACGLNRCGLLWVLVMHEGVRYVCTPTHNTNN